MKLSIRKKSIFLSLYFALVCAAVILCVSAIMPLRSDAAENTATRSPADLWSGTAGVTVQAAADLPTRMTQGYENHNEATHRYVEADDLADWQRNGVLISMESDQDVVEFRNIIDISTLTKDDRLIDIMPVASVNPIYSKDFSDLHITLTDADDPDVWFTMHLHAPDISDFSLKENFPSVSFMTVETCTGVNKGFQYGRTPGEFFDMGSMWHSWGFGLTFTMSGFYNSVRPGNVNWSTGVQSEGLTLEDMRALPYSLRYDTALNSVWTVLQDFTLREVLPLGMETMTGEKEVYKDGQYVREPVIDEPIMGYGKAFPGFKHNRVKLSIRVDALERSPAQFYVLNVAGHGMNGDAIVETEAPSILSRQNDEDLPVANIGMEYPFYDTEFYDFYDGIIPYEVYVKDVGESEFSAQPIQKFIPTKEGDVTFSYRATDLAGNLAEKLYTVRAQYAAPSIAIEVASSATYGVGERCVLPAATYTGGSGKLTTVERVVRLSDGKEIEIENGAFVPVLQGNYALVYSATDYLGRTAEKTVVIEVTDSRKPVYATELKMAKKLVSGERVKLPHLTAYDYTTTPGQRLNALTEITICGQGEFSNVSETNTDGIFMPTVEKFGERITVTYTTYLGDKDGDVKDVKTFEIDLVKPDYIWDYFLADENTAIGYNAEDESDNYVSFTANASGNAGVTFINPLPTNGFVLQFGAATGYTANSFDAFTVDLYDYDDASIRYTLKITYKDSGNANVEFDGEQSVMSGAFGSSDAVMRLSLSGGKVLDYGRNVVCDLGDNAFPSGRLWAEMSVSNATAGAGIYLRTIGAQTLRASYRNHQMQKFSYTVAPTIVVDDFDNEVQFGDRFVIPQAKAYDMFTLYTEAMYTLTDPAGNTVASGRVADGTDAYVFDRYGEYTLTFTAQNGAGRRRNLPYSLYVFDKTPPLIVYNGQTEMTVSVGSAVTFPEISVFDSVDTAPQYVVFVIERDGAYKNITADRTYTFGVKGTYSVRYIAYDADDNTATVDVRITVR